MQAEVTGFPFFYPQRCNWTLGFLLTALPKLGVGATCYLMRTKRKSTSHSWDAPFSILVTDTFEWCSWCRFHLQKLWVGPPACVSCSALRRVFWDCYIFYFWHGEQKMQQEVSLIPVPSLTQQKGSNDFLLPAWSVAPSSGFPPREATSSGTTAARHSATLLQQTRLPRARKAQAPKRRRLARHVKGGGNSGP